MTRLNPPGISTNLPFSHTKKSICQNSLVLFILLLLMSRFSVEKGKIFKGETINEIYPDSHLPTTFQYPMTGRGYYHPT
jgi:hypothetical protein